MSSQETIETKKHWDTTSDYNSTSLRYKDDNFIVFCHHILLTRDDSIVQIHYSLKHKAQYSKTIFIKSLEKKPRSTIHFIMAKEHILGYFMPQSSSGAACPHL